ncbi:uncharacterized protein BDR25DRAFT_253201 [Lindgomyces ingoldianus]|uniref:Uncharacterized protein n=1 Tax=Lindgomyces ingoldianus TaxID=673940 RepID=A0ACB6RAE8_9PLEO|nr:uncharacterized protein BDR25DRAFT_253201 [Lindgomyces ingoldianus]KAF2475705.1 hypothetical protein BDR25DRAFT_253201 [Lindgomyces ingoldianus]
MPRPKRTKVAPAATRVAKTSKAAAPISRSNPTRKISENIDSFSDDSDGLVVRTNRAQRRMPWQPEPEKDVDFTMTGGLPVEQNEDRTAEPKTKAPQPRVMRPSSKSRTPPSAAPKKTRTSMAGKKSQAQGTSTPEPHPHIEPAQVDDSLSDTLFTFGSLDSDSPAHGTRPPSAMKVLGTPAHETSILALKNFKRRPRQPSLLRMVNQMTDMGDDDFDDLDDFNPEAESTPLHLQKSGPEEVSSNSDLHPSASSSGSWGRKRKLSSPVVQVLRSSPPFDSPSGADVQESRSSSPSLPEVIESREEVLKTKEGADYETMSETMAPPRSSSLPADETVDSPVKPRQNRKRRETKKKLRNSVDADIEDEESELPVKPNAKQKPKPKPKPKAISTARLQALLPRRRTHVPQEYDEFDIRSSDNVDITPVDSDQDELQLPPRRGAPASAAAAAQLRSSKKLSRTTKKPQVPTITTQKNTRTYGRRTSSDKENESTFVQEDSSGDVDETTATTISVPKSKLTAIAKQFEEVDAWEMEFESVDVSGASSSPWR